MNIDKSATTFIVLLLSGLFSSTQAHAQQCSGKRIEFRLVACNSTECDAVRQKIWFIGDKVILYDDNPDTGLIFRVGRTTEYTDAEVPSLRETVRAVPSLARARLAASATFESNMLRLRQEHVYFTRSGEVNGNTYAVNEIEVLNCRTCRVMDFEIRSQTAQKVSVYRLRQSRSCEITDAR